MRGPTSYDDGYISRKLSSLQTSPTFLSPTPSYGRSIAGGYLQPFNQYIPKRRAFYRVTYLPGGGKETRYVPLPRSNVRYSRSLSPEPLLRSESIPREFSVPPSGRTYMPSAQTQLILNRIAVTPRDYPPLSPRLTPRMTSSSYLDYDYGYGGAYGYGGGYGDYPRPLPRARYDSYIDDDYELPMSSYTPRYGRATRLADAIVEAERDKQLRMSPVRTTTTTTYTMPPFTHTRNISPRILQDEVDKMRIRLKGLSYSLDPNGPVPEIIVADRSRRANSLESARRYTSGPKHLACVEYAGGVPQWKRKARASHRYPIEDQERLSLLYRDEYEADLVSAAKDPERLILKDRLSLKIHSFLGDSMEPDKFQRYLKTYRTPGLPPKDAQWREEYYKPKLYKAGDGLSSTYSSRYPAKSITGASTSKWEEPDTIYGTDKHPYSKTADGDEDDSKKERRKKKKSRERDILSAETTSAITASSSAGDFLADADAGIDADAELDDKEKKRLEKKKRKAEREAAAKAAMEAELDALAAAEAELAMLEEQTGSLKQEVPAADVAEPEIVADIAPVEEAAIDNEPAPAETEPDPEVPEEKCELVSDTPDELFTDTYSNDESKHDLPPVTDSILYPQENNTFNDTINNQTEQEYTETTNAPLDTPIEPIQSSQEPIEYEQTLVDEPIKTEPETECLSEPIVLSSDRIEPIDVSTEQIDEPVVESSLESEVLDKSVTEQEVQQQNTIEEGNPPPQEEDEYVEPTKKTIKAETEFDWADFDAVDTTDPVDIEAQQRGGSGRVSEPVGRVEEDEVSASNDVLACSEVAQNEFE